MEEILNIEGIPELPKAMLGTLHLMMQEIQSVFHQEAIHISIEQFGILAILASGKDLIQQDLADLMNKDKSSILRQLNRLEEQKMTARIQDKSDKRKKQIVITKQGLEALALARKAEAKVIEQMLKGVNPIDLKTLFMVMQQLQNNLKK